MVGVGVRDGREAVKEAVKLLDAPGLVVLTAFSETS